MGTLFHKTKIDLQKWFYVISLTINPHDKTPVREIGETIGATKDTAWSMQKKIKKALLTHSDVVNSIEQKIKS